MQEIERSRLSIHPAIRHPYKHRFRCLRPTHKLPRPPDSSVKFNGSYGEHRKIAISSWKRLLCRLHAGKDGGGIAIPPVISGGGEGLLISCFIGRGYNACLRLLPRARTVDPWKFAYTILREEGKEQGTRGVGLTRQHVEGVDPSSIGWKTSDSPLFETLFRDLLRYRSISYSLFLLFFLFKDDELSNFKEIVFFA